MNDEPKMRSHDKSRVIIPILTRSKEINCGFELVRAEAPAPIRPSALAMSKCNATTKGTSMWRFRCGLRDARLASIRQLRFLKSLTGKRIIELATGREGYSTYASCNIPRVASSRGDIPTLVITVAPVLKGSWSSIAPPTIRSVPNTKR